MKRMLVLSAAALVLLVAQASSARAANPTIQVDGQLAGGNFVTATCTVANGQITGTGVLYGQNAVTGATYRYAFAITKGVTANGKLVLTGQIAGGPALSLSASVPSGAMVFSYIVNNKTYSLAGQGTVVLK
jgi:hypothetical protein